ncbi:hypothetical protein HOC96_00045 [archaeon]|nr:hypothetical protein [archaeon]
MKWVLPLFFLFLLMPVALADSCSLTNLAECLPERFFEYVLELVNAPLEWLLGFIQTLLAQPIEISDFSELWAISVYIISMFYGLLLLYSGFNFMISGYDSSKREQAKEWLKNIIIMIVLVQASYLIYTLILDVNSALTTSVFNLINEDFFVFTFDSFHNLASEIMFGFGYLLTLFVTIIVLVVRYIALGFGVAFFPIAIFCYFIPPLRSFGKSIVSFLLVNIFMSFFASIILLMGSMLLETSVFETSKILVMIASFLLVDIMLLYFLFSTLIMGGIGAVLSYKTLGLMTAINKIGTATRSPNTGGHK